VALAYQLADSHASKYWQVVTGPMSINYIDRSQRAKTPPLIVNDVLLTCLLSYIQNLGERAPLLRGLPSSSRVA